MPTASRRRTVQAVAASGAAHAVLFAVLAVQSPTLNPPPQVPSPPIPIIPILIVPRPPPPPVGGPPPEPIKLHRRPQAFARHFPVPPLPAPEKDVETPTAHPRVVIPPPEPEVSRSELRAVLRTGPAGCANLAALSQAERERCTETLGAGARFAPYQGLGLAADKQQVFDRAAAARDADRRYRRAQPVPSRPGGDTGVTATDMAGALGETRR